MLMGCVRETERKCVCVCVFVMRVEEVGLE